VIVQRPYNFRATVVGYVAIGVIVAFVIHLIVLSSPRYNWIFPVEAGASAPMVNPAPGAK
jgi:hypothetical protein